MMVLLAAGELPYGFNLKRSDSGLISTSFKLYAPDAKAVYLHLFKTYDAAESDSRLMTKDQSNWVYNIDKDLTGFYYGYQVINHDIATQQFSPETIIADPYTTAAVTQNHYAPTNKSLIYKESFDWEGDKWLNIDHRDLIIYEAHIKDMTAHKSSGAELPGTYLGFIEKGQKGGIKHLVDMGYNAVEFLPLFDFANVEIPYKDQDSPVYNDWNPYAGNHWGYMPTFLFAPEGRYATDGSTQANAWSGTVGRQINEFKTVVKEMHKNGIAVILDVVYNHVSQYDNHPLKQMNKNDYFRQDKNGNYSSVSGCGNDLKTEHPFIRQMIIESVLYWMTEYHIDGFRFDLGKLIDWQTIEEIINRAKELNPNVFITCEPWGGGYDPNGFSDRGWSSWNDQFRNALKGWHPDGSGGYLFAKWNHGFTRDNINRIFLGSPRSQGGQFVDVAHSLNYLESHDDHTLGDFIRIELGISSKDEFISDIDGHVELSEEELKIHKLAATALLTSQGPVMIAQGQEWARSKIIADAGVEDERAGRIDHNSYEKDNETNWLNWNHKDINAELMAFYKKLIALRNKEPAFRRQNPEEIELIYSENNEFGLGYVLDSEDDKRFLVLLNSGKSSAIFNLPVGNWQPRLTSSHLPRKKYFNKVVEIDPQSMAIFMAAR